MPAQIVFRRLAKREMDESIAWYENQRAQLGLELAVEINRTLQNISQSPKQFPLTRGEARRALVRRFPYAGHYVIENDLVLAVFHVKRNPSLLEDR